MIRYVYYCSFLAFFLLPAVVFGQGFLSGNRTSIELSTYYPEPHESIEATVLNQNSSNLPGDLVWRINGTVNSAYTNKRTIEFSASDLGTPTVIQVLKNGTTLAQQVVNPVYIDIGIDPLTHIPQHYLGRAEITPGSTVLLTALTEEAVKHDPSTYTYTWEVNGKVIEGGAWKGNHQVQVPVPIGASTIKIKVTVSRPGIGKVGEETIEAPVRNTVTNFYRVSSLYGLLPQALENTYNLRDNAITIQAIPYFIGSEAMTGGTIEWKLDNRPMQPDTPFVITLKPNQAQGRSTVTFRQYNQSNFSQQAQQTLQVTY